jgi:hypothetical protein
MNNSGLETSLGRNFTGFDIENNNYVCVWVLILKRTAERHQQLTKQFLFEELV